MDPLALGLTLALVGIGGTLAALTAIALIAALLKRLFPERVASPLAGEAGQADAVGTDG